MLNVPLAVVKCPMNLSRSEHCYPAFDAEARASRKIYTKAIINIKSDQSTL